MSAAEILHRLRSLAWMTFHRNLAPPSVRVQPAKSWDPARPAFSDPARSRLLEEADAYLDHRWLFFGLGGEQEPEIDWQRDPASGRDAPRIFSPKIKFQDPLLVGNIKNTWEKNRHHHLTVLAAAYALTGAERYALEAADQILDWVVVNPFPVGANWISPLECGIRLVSWVWCERLLRSSSHHERVFGAESPGWISVYQHQMFIDHAFARGSSANNHLIGEMAGQFIASAAWPVFAESQAWRDRAASILEDEITRQTFPSGLNREQAFGYHLFVAEFLLMVLYEGNRAGQQFSEQFKQSLRRMVEAIPLLTDAGGNLPAYGDGDNGMAVQLQSAKDRRDTWLFDFARALLDADVPASGQPSLSALLAGFAQVPPREWRAPSASRAFEDAGLYVLQSARGTEKEVLVLFDAGPQGYLRQAAHGHADALSFTLSVGGRPVLVDPGTFCYHSDPAWRSYFRGTRAHNTVTVDGRDQSVPGGTFLWLKRADAKVVSWEPERQTIVAEHDGYRRLPGGVVHARKLALSEGCLELEDEVRGEREHLLEWRFHFAPDCDVRLEETRCEASWAGGTIKMSLDPAVEWALVREGSSAGWVSPSFGVRKSAVTLCGTRRQPLPARVTTSIRFSP